MALGSFANDGLIDLDEADLRRMLSLDETLFVEHKSGIGKESAHQLVKAVASFANTVGGWLLVGVHDGDVQGGSPSWAQDGPPFVDAVRDRLRGEIDPLPAFEAKIFWLDDAPVGVVRVYESADTPHVAIQSGAVWVREVAGSSDASTAGKSGSGKKSTRAYEATQIRTRAQLLELSQRSRSAQERVVGLVDPLRPLPLIQDSIGLSFERAGGGVQPAQIWDRGGVFVRLAPHTLLPRFRGWTTSSMAAAALLESAESLADVRGLGNDFVRADPSGAAVGLGIEAGVRQRDSMGAGLEARANVVVDGAGVVGASLLLAEAGADRQLSVRLSTLAEEFILPTLEAAVLILERGEFLGRALCQIDLAFLGRALLLREAADASGRFWVPVRDEVVLPVDDSQLSALVRRVANAYGRSAGIPAWD